MMEEIANSDSFVKIELGMYFDISSSYSSNDLFFRITIPIAVNCFDTEAKFKEE